MHVKTKPTNDKISGVIYTIPCDGRPYVGETEQTLKERPYEHKRAVGNGHLSNAIAVATY